PLERAAFLVLTIERRVRRHWPALSTPGRVVIMLGVIKLAGAFALISGNANRGVIAIVRGSLGAIGALLSITGSNPSWSLGIVCPSCMSSAASSSTARTGGFRPER